MCVLTFFPKSEDSFILTSNRDEAVARPSAFPPKKYLINGEQVFYPKDPQGNGTWIATSETYTLCLLNGGIEKHIPNPPYRQSRGKVILDFYNFYGTKDFFDNYNFEGIEPFTLVVIESYNALIMNEIRWTGELKTIKQIDETKPNIWSSVTLYSHEIIQLREKWFEDFLKDNDEIDREKIIEFHQKGGNGDKSNSIKMNRENKLKTISITQFEIKKQQTLIRYEDLLLDKTYHFRVFKELIVN